MPNILKVDASARYEASKSRKFSAMLAEKLVGDGTIVARDVAAVMPYLTERFTEATYMKPQDRNAAQAGSLVFSDSLVEELQAADILVIGTPVYNFGMPATLKAWFDQICRAGVTFRYTENGPEGLLNIEKAYVVVSSGGVTVGSDTDFITPHLRFLLGFVGIKDVTFIEATGLNGDENAGLERAEAQIEAIYA